MIIGLDKYNKKLICSECGSTIDGPYHRYDISGKILCKKCTSIALLCDVCGNPSSLLDKYYGLKACPKCISRSDKCERCGKKLDSSNRKYIKGISAFYCSDCVSKTETRCDICNRPVKSKTQLIKTSIGKMICEECNKIHIFSIDKGKNILNNIAKIIQSKFGLDYDNIPHLYLSSDVELKYLKKMKSNKIINTYERKSISAYDGKSPSLYILAGLQLDKFLSSFIIEYIMCWSITYNKANYNGDMELSLAKWISIKILSLLGYQNEKHELVMREAINNRKSNLIKLLTIEKNSGIDGVINFAIYRKRKVI